MNGVLVLLASVLIGGVFALIEFVFHACYRKHRARLYARAQMHARADAVACALDDSAVWITADGRTMRISDMDSSHLANTIRFISRSIKRMQKYAPVYPALLEEADRRGLTL